MIRSICIVWVFQKQWSSLPFKLSECTLCNGLLEACGRLSYLDQQERYTSEKVFDCVHRHNAFAPWK